MQRIHKQLKTVSKVHIVQKEQRHLQVSHVLKDTIAQRMPISLSRLTQGISQQEKETCNKSLDLQELFQMKLLLLIVMCVQLGMNAL